MPIVLEGSKAAVVSPDLRLITSRTDKGMLVSDLRTGFALSSPFPMRGGVAFSLGSDNLFFFSHDGQLLVVQDEDSPYVFTLPPAWISEVDDLVAQTCRETLPNGLARLVEEEVRLAPEIESEKERDVCVAPTLPMTLRHLWSMIK